MASNWLRRVAHALTLAIAAYGAGDAKSAVQEGQFNLFVTDPVPLEGSFFTGIFQPWYDLDGQIAGVLNFAVEVTDLVRARQQVERQRDELILLNIALHWRRLSHSPRPKRAC